MCPFSPLASLHDAYNQAGLLCPHPLAFLLCIFVLLSSAFLPCPDLSDLHDAIISVPVLPVRGNTAKHISLECAECRSCHHKARGQHERDQSHGGLECVILTNSSLSALLALGPFFQSRHCHSKRTVLRNIKCPVSSNQIPQAEIQELLWLISPVQKPNFLTGKFPYLAFHQSSYKLKLGA